MKSNRYEETTKVVYEQNTFDFDTPLSLLMFAHEMRPAHLNSIKSIIFDLRHLWTYEDMWKQCCELIAGMQGLLELRVRFHHPGGLILGGPKRQRDLLGPLCEIKTKLDVFEVEVPGEADGWIEREMGEMGEMPFVLLRTSSRVRTSR